MILAVIRLVSPYAYIVSGPVRISEEYLSYIIIDIVFYVDLCFNIIICAFFSYGMGF